ncbi:MAG: hypothetical protein H0X25_16565 [Acidobacteriales bacterium]|nr:hypothetical protein [Terriglobales bacterium]
MILSTKEWQSTPTKAAKASKPTYNGVDKIFIAPGSTGSTIAHLPGTTPVQKKAFMFLYGRSMAS